MTTSGPYVSMDAVGPNAWSPSLLTGDLAADWISHSAGSGWF